MALGISDFGGFDRTNEWSVWVFKFQEMDKLITSGPFPGEDKGFIYTVFVLAKLWMDARPLAEMKLNKMRWEKRRGSYPMREGTMTWAEVTSGTTRFTQGSVFVFKVSDRDTEEITLAGDTEREGVLGLARTRIGEHVERERRRADERAASRVQEDRPPVNKREAKRPAKNRNRSSSRR